MLAGVAEMPPAPPSRLRPPYLAFLASQPDSLPNSDETLTMRDIKLDDPEIGVLIRPTRDEL
ncbi:two-component system response regulator [Novosphingobium sp. PY1]|nr:two-component system response regulator [Novosphingobium sp. PY1]